MTEPAKASVCIIYPADPLGVIPGGIDTYIRGVIRWAPEDISVRVVGASTEPESRPVGRWTTCQVGGSSFQFYPVFRLKNSERQARIPVVLRFLAALLRRPPSLPVDVLEFHRIEPCLGFLRDTRPKTLVMHQNMQDLRNARSDIRWSYAPGLYFSLEDRIIPRLASVFCVREDATRDYRRRFPRMAPDIHFTPTWVDTETFRPATPERRAEGRSVLTQSFGFGEDDLVLMTVGRLDAQKNPLLLLEAFRKFHAETPRARLLFVGDGVLRPRVEREIRNAGLDRVVRLSGVKPASEITRYLSGADAFVMSSAYEGMPIAVLEALRTGLPVVSTDVGEVSRVVRSGVNGELVTAHDAAALASAIASCERNLAQYRGRPCTDAVEPFTPEKVLRPVYENYRRLAVASA